ncbi:MAG TPA: multiheme c-type cytochrome [Candidatus Eisenbacteria bacterium]|nr:multiheme c-type cytochrome [Candidatus Eisenbacteria bacterium]
MLVDDGGFFPEDSLHIDSGWFLMDGMKLIGTDAVGLGDRELKFGVSYLKYHVKRSNLPIVCANLFDKATKKPIVQPYLIKNIGRAKVGVFGLISNTADLGPSKDSLTVEEPSAAAKRTIAELRKKGATVVVLLSQLGKVESEDLVTAVDGVDAVIVGRNVPLLQKGRMIKNTVANYGGEQGQYIGRTIVTLDKAGRMTTGDDETFILGPEVGEKKEIASLVKNFEDNQNEKMRKVEQEQAVRDAQRINTSPDHYLGAEVCERCHQAEAAQWKTTGHSHAWQTLVDAKKDANPDCIVCHVLGYKQSGGFQSAAATPGLSNVQCESCHGMGTQHEAFASVPRQVTEQTCRGCHTATSSPVFTYAVYAPHIMHHYTGTMPPLPPKPASSTMMGGH